MIAWAHHDAPHPAIAANQELSSDKPAAAKPSTVAGPTKGPASALASNPDTLTAPDSAATTGNVARCAASGTATASANGRGSQAAVATQDEAHQTMPPLANTDNAKPTDLARKGSTSTRSSTATAS